ncbi:MAG TPA: toprim domain-containing protein [Chloroflexia bacterium]|nr:toprim domain-containing protein [Chloroflexia bacterium]
MQPSRRAGELTLAELSLLAHSENREATEWRMACPLHSGSNPTSFSVDLRRGLYHCFACGAGGLLREFACGSAGKVNFESTGLAGKLRLEYIPPKAECKRPIQFKVSDLAVRKQRLLMAQAHLAWLAHLPGDSLPLAYLKARGITPAMAMRMGAGYESNFHFPVFQKNTFQKEAYNCPALLFPLYLPVNGKPLFANFYARGLASGGARLHYVAPGPKGFFNLRALFRARVSVRGKEPLILVEGVFDALAMLEVGYTNVLALLGTSLINPCWFRGLRKIVVALDNDEAGRLGQAKIFRQLSALGVECLDFTLDSMAAHKDFAEYWAAEGSKPRKLAKNSRKSCL